MRRESGSTQISGLNDDLLKARAALEDAQAAVKRHEATLATKTREISDLERKSAEAAKSLQAAEQEKSALGIKIDTLTSQLAAREKERKDDAATRQSLQTELDDLRKVMAAKSSEDIKRNEADRSRETEMARLRDQVAASQKALEEQVAQSQKLSEKLRVDFEGIATAYKTAQAEVKTLKAAIAAREKEVEGVKGDKERYEREARDSASELGRVRERIKGMEGELGAMSVSRDVSLAHPSDTRAGCPC